MFIANFLRDLLQKLLKLTFYTWLFYNSIINSAIISINLKGVIVIHFPKNFSVGLKPVSLAITMPDERRSIVDIYKYMVTDESFSNVDYKDVNNYLQRHKTHNQSQKAILCKSIRIINE